MQTNFDVQAAVLTLRRNTIASFLALLVSVGIAATTNALTVQDASAINCKVTKILAQTDLGNGYVDFPAGVESRLGFFLPSIIVRGAVECGDLPPGWELGFVQMLEHRTDVVSYPTTTLSMLKRGPLADAAGSPNGRYRAVSNRNAVRPNQTTQSEFSDQPRSLVPWKAPDETRLSDQGLGFKLDFRATIHLVLLNAAESKLVLLKKLVWQGAMDAQCLRTTRRCELATVERNAVTVAPVNLQSFPSSALFGPLANEVNGIETWSPSTSSMMKTEKGSASN